MPEWRIYTGSGDPHDDIAEKLPQPPPWRKFTGSPALPVPLNVRQPPVGHQVPAERGSRPAGQRRLVPAQAASGDRSARHRQIHLAYAVAHELMLGPVLLWPITSRATLREGLYEYDPLSRLEAPANPRAGRLVA